MIFYNPTDNDVLTKRIKYNPRSAFIMTQLGGVKTNLLDEILSQLKTALNQKEIHSLDANSLITGKDFLSKIWNLALSSPIGIAVLSENMQQTTVANIYYELGLMNALGKETVVIKTPKFKIPSDFIRTEYIKYDNSFEKKMDSFLQQIFEQAEYYGVMADSLIAKPLLSIDYLRRAYLITQEDVYKNRALEIIKSNKFDEHTSMMVNSYFDIS
ncbi:MAG: hypothetical protein ABJF11_06245 [Reichenbachiella sp.]|uniref:hypothetical protein n=1 Tax=Reichenbachiella sp. TaxID=2184521 RepID=UPI0032634390